jgi:peptide-methionine (S)-S-oxide reductase
MQEEKLFDQAVAAIDAGDLTSLEKLIHENPELLTQRYHSPDNGYFANPYLLWFIANNPIRAEKMPAAIIPVTRLLIDQAKRHKVADLKDQLDYTLRLVVSGRISKEEGVQIPLAALLISEGAKPAGSLGALAHHNLEAARFLIEQGEPVQLIAAVCLDLPVASEMLEKASQQEKQEALVGASFFGKPDAMKLLIAAGADVNGYIGSTGFHSHATALHQAVFSDSLEAVTLLVEAGADLYAKDKIYGGTPLGWAESGETDAGTSSEVKAKLRAIAGFLRARMTE